MKQSGVEKTRMNRDRLGLGLLMVVAAIIAVPAFAQDFRSFHGTNERTGRASIQPSTAVAENVWNNAGRGFLRWWDPIFEAGTEVDNPSLNANILTGTWDNPSPFGVGANPFLAQGYVINSATEAPYLYALTTTAGGISDPDPSAGATASFTWNLTGLIAGSEYTVEVNVPTGPTNVNPLGVDDLRFTPHYQLYSVQSNTGTDFYWLDLFNAAGGYAELADGLPFEAMAGGNIRVTLYNVIRRNDFGTQIDPLDQPGTDIVYADAVQAVSRSPRGVANSIATPVVGQLTQAPLDAPTFGVVSDQRVFSSRNEDAFFGALNKEIRFGTVTSFTHNGEMVDAFTPLRRNMVWSWPATRPLDLTQAESDRYAVDRQNWVLGAPNPNYPRYLVFRQADNLSAGTTIGAGFIDDNTFSSRGPNYTITPAVGATSSFVTWNPVANEGKYFIEVYLPNNDPNTALATNVTYEILQGGTVVATRTINQSVLNNWVRLPNQLEDGYTHSQAAPLSVRVLNQGSAQDVVDGRDVYADAVRFVGDADLGITSTPVLTVADVNPGTGTTTRDVLVVARENGSITAMEAHGNDATASQQHVLWTYPSEDVANDPNDDPTEDYGITENPTKFNLSSALVTNVGGVDLLYIGSDNGKVYCLEMQGRGDGTTRRRWTWPDDFNPTNPLVPMQPGVGPIKGSIALANFGGTPHIIVPDSNGKVYALDAAGNAASKTTTMTWEYPAFGNNLGALEMTPVVAFGQITFAAANIAAPTEGVIHSLVEDAGTAGVANVAWTRDTRQDGVTPFGLFGSAAPVAVNAPIVANDSLYFVDNVGYITSINAATGNVQWEELSVPSASVANLSFAYMRTYNGIGSAIVDDIPTVLVAATSGALLGFYADGTTNINGSRINWGYYVESNGNQVSGIAVGGWPNAAGLLANRTHLYTTDGDGLLYAFSSEDDSNSVPPITPGIPPGRQTATPNDPNQAVLNGLIQQDDVLVLSLDQYRTLTNAAQAGTLTWAMLDNIKTSAPMNRRHFDYGESVYLAVMNIPETTVTSSAGYYIAATLSGGTNSTRPLVTQVRDVTGAPSPDEGGVALIGIPLLPTGQNAVGPVQVTVEVSARIGRVNGVGVHPRQSASDPLVDIRIANPLGIAFTNPGGGTNSAGLTINPADPLVTGTLPPGISTAVATPYNKWTTGFIAPAPLTEAVPGAWLSTTNGGVDPVAHGSVGKTDMQVYDRSAMILQNNRGLQGVQVRNSDLSWQPNSNFAPTNATQAGIANQLPAYANGFEDFPNQYPNLSLDYPDLRRSGMQITKSLRGTSQNPLFNGVSLNPPLNVDRTTYSSSVAAYEAGLSRTLSNTPFAISLNIPRYQPAATANGSRTSGYAASNIIYVDQGKTGYDINDAARGFTLGANVAADVRLNTDTKTVDLGSTPAGGGMFDPSTGAPNNPWANNLFGPFNTAFMGANPQFQQFSVLNEGNVNLLNVRLSKRFGVINGGSQVERPLELYAGADHELGWLDGSTTMFSDLDPQLSPIFRAGVDPSGQVFLQKPRPGDPAPSRLKTNPRRRQNSNLNVNSGTLIADIANFPDADPYVGVAIPIGAPVGSYVRPVFPFEDVPGTNVDPNVPTLGYYSTGLSFNPESFADPGFTLKFNVRETRLTNRSTAKSSNLLENIVPADPGMEWSNRQPSISRDAQGNLFTAWSSNRLDAGNNPDFLARGRNQLDVANQDVWRIYFANMSSTGLAGGVGSNPLRDLTAWTSAGAGDPTWLHTAGQLPIGNEWNNWFALQTGEALQAPLDPSAARFFYPTFAAQGFINPLAPASPSRPTFADRYMAFVGETTKLDRSGKPVSLSQVMIANLNFGTTTTRNNTGPLNGIFPIADDPTSKKGRPSLVQNGTGASVFYTAQSSGRAELYGASFNGTTWSQAQSLGLAANFEEVGAPTALLRTQSTAVAGSTGAAITVFFTGQVRGRTNAEGFMGELSANRGGQLVPNAAWRIFEDRLDRLEYDSTTGVYWTPGVHWAMGPDDVDQLELTVLNPVTGQLESLIRNTTVADRRTRVVDRTTREMVFEGTRGGKIYIDALRGSVRLSGTILGRGAQIFATYSPRFVRVSGAQGAFNVGNALSPGGERIARSNTSTGANYRGASAVYDDRMLGVYLDPVLAERALIEDVNFWYDGNGAALGSPFPVRQDRFYLAFNRTSGDGAAAARPVMSSMRFGVYLPTPVAIAPNGTPRNLTVTVQPPLPGDPPNPALPNIFVQVDPASGKLFIPAEFEGVRIQIRYDGVDVNGNLLTNIVRTERVGLVHETGEQVVPIEQVGREGDFFMSLDRINPNDPFTNNRRPPLLWMIWSSSRTGAPDVYFQTLAPKTTASLRRP
ncbi:MAG: hypothetical protein KF824_07610 [Fimbriimonadaceae bacterium]|nr:MAG: hypothetical protein KF824_07610 [Fimbriimonadaceae bacterium]